MWTRTQRALRARWVLAKLCELVAAILSSENKVWQCEWAKPQNIQKNITNIRQNPSQYPWKKHTKIQPWRVSAWGDNWKLIRTGNPYGDVTDEFLHRHATDCINKWRWDSEQINSYSFYGHGMSCIILIWSVYVMWGVWKDDRGRGSPWITKIRAWLAGCGS